MESVATPTLMKESASPAVIPHAAHRSKPLPLHRIEIKLRDMSQLFNSMDPSPFHEKDLDHDAEEFIVSWAQEYHRHEPVALVIYLKEFPEGQDPKTVIEPAVHNYFAYRARLNRLEFKRLLKQGRLSLIIGLSFLAICTLASELLLASQAVAPWLSVVREGLIIAGWVAMWRPMQTYLYDWWPLRRKGQIYHKLSRMHVEVRKRD